MKLGLSPGRENRCKELRMYMFNAFSSAYTPVTTSSARRSVERLLWDDILIHPAIPLNDTLFERHPR